MARIFFSYSHRDEALRDELEKHMAMLKRQGLIESWHDRRIVVGSDLDPAIDDELERADLVLLLVSPDFLASDYCFGTEMARALERRAKGEIQVVPVILRDCDWKHSPLGGLLCAPRDGRPIVKWADRDEAFQDVVSQIRMLLGARSGGGRVRSAGTSAPSSIARAPVMNAPRSSNLRLKKSFSEADKDGYRDDSFEFMARFFEASLTELQSRNSGVEGRFKRVDAHRFTSVVYRHGKAVARCTVRLGGSFGSGISFSATDNADANSINENLSVEAGDHDLHLKPLGLASFGAVRDKALSQQGAAEYYWDIFIRNLQ